MERLPGGNGAGSCAACGQLVNGSVEVYEQRLRDGTPVIVLGLTPDRDHNVCDLCNRVVHFRCSQHPDTGFCDDCYAQVNDDSLKFRV